jgi:hypothetical protein
LPSPVGSKGNGALPQKRVFEHRILEQNAEYF